MRAHVLRDLVDVHYPEAEKIVLVLDNLNTHDFSSLYETFEPEKAWRIRQKIEMHYTPKHGSWLNMAEIELAVLSGQCLDQRIGEEEMLRQEIAAWEAERNTQQVKVNWRFTTKVSRIKLKRLYPVLYAVLIMTDHELFHTFSYHSLTSRRHTRASNIHDHTH